MKEVIETPYITVKKASKIANVTMGTVRRWAQDFKIGFKIGGRWVIYEDGLYQVLKGQLRYNYKQKTKHRVNKVYINTDGADDEKIG